MSIPTQAPLGQAETRFPLGRIVVALVLAAVVLLIFRSCGSSDMAVQETNATDTANTTNAAVVPERRAAMQEALARRSRALMAQPAEKPASVIAGQRHFAVDVRNGGAVTQLSPGEWVAIVVTDSSGKPVIFGRSADGGFVANDVLFPVYCNGVNAIFDHADMARGEREAVAVFTCF